VLRHSDAFSRIIRVATIRNTRVMKGAEAACKIGPVALGAIRQVMRAQTIGRTHLCLPLDWAKVLVAPPAAVMHLAQTASRIRGVVDDLPRGTAVGTRSVPLVRLGLGTPGRARLLPSLVMHDAITSLAVSPGTLASCDLARSHVMAQSPSASVSGCAFPTMRIKTVATSGVLGERITAHGPLTLRTGLQVLLLHDGL